MDTKSPAGKMTLTMFATTSLFERANMLARQSEGVTRAKLRPSRRAAIQRCGIRLTRRLRSKLKV